MSPTTATPIHSPVPVPAALPLSQLDEPSLDASVTESQRTAADRPQRKRTPTPRGRLFQADVRRSHALSAKIQHTKARKSRGKAEGGGKGKGKCGPTTPEFDACDTSNDDEDDDDDDGVNSDNSWIVDDSSEVVPTSDPRELEQEGGSTFRTELDDPEFCAEFSKQLATLCGGGAQKHSRKTLKEALYHVRRDKEATLGSSQWYAKADSLPEQVIEGGSGFHLDYEPQPGQKRRFVPPQPGPSKRGRLTTSGTPSTVLDDNPNPIPRPAFLMLERSMEPPLLPRSATDLGPLDSPPQLPVSAAGPVLPRSRPQPTTTRIAASQQLGAQSGRPHPTHAPRAKPDTSYTQCEDTQTIPEDTQTIPEDTQTIPEDTQTVPEETQTNPVATQPRPTTQPDNRLPRSSAQTPTPSMRASVAPSMSTSASNLSRTSALPNSVPRSASQLETMSDKFDRNERHRARAYTILQKRKGQQRDAGYNDDDDLLDDDEAEQVEASNSAKSKPSRRKPKSGLNCQPGRPRQAATRAITDVTAYAFAKCPYYTRATGIIWSLEAYERAYAVEFPGALPEEPRPELIGAICDRIPGGRTVLKENIRSSIAKSYGFQENPETEDELQKNLAIYRDNQEDFHMGSRTDPQTHYEHPALKKAFLAGFFAASHSPCVIYHQYFNPVPVETIATLLVMMETCIGEWRTGNLVLEHLNAKQQAILYDKHLANLGVFADGAPDRLCRMRKGFYAAGLRKIVPKANPESSTKATIRLEDIRADTPPPAGPVGL